MLWSRSRENSLISAANAKDMAVYTLALKPGRRGHRVPASSHQSLLTQLLPATHHIATEWMFHLCQDFGIGMLPSKSNDELAKVSMFFKVRVP